ncbi:thrombospondin type I repeat-containing protein [Tieghemostelium lacteum]|uniref:Thrombospondin type I repeat-containing protein n=1 Tax=Tieghemostelium lacteum TaxID=361077 RepID=A0A151Z8N0_TIELA|nr:thrombospondin type I repeat-containing protein [Tieghemostelium lacteum]|eukprot:KYQ90315.1 thrombospondin type I repeat-containing protein [Tieghemostelium lacteum]
MKMKLYSYSITIVVSLLLIVFITPNQSIYSPNIKPFTLKPIISIGNYCPFTNYGLEVVIEDYTYTLLIDTQNTMTMLNSEECKYGCIPLEYNYRPSPDSIIEKPEINGYYLDDTAWYGQLVADRLLIQNASVNFNTRFVSITAQSKPLSNPICDASTLLAHGSIGLGYSRQETSFLLQYTRALNISEIFSISFCENNPRIWFGGYDTSILSTPLANTETDKKTYNFELKNVFIGNSTLFQVTDFVWKSILDTSSPFIHLPSSIFHQTIQYLAKEKKFTNYFSSRFFLEKKCILNPLVEFTVDEINAMFPKLRFVYQSDRPNSEIQLNAIPSYLLLEGDMICPGIVEALNYQTVFGIPLFKQYLVMFDQGKGRLGFGKADKCYSYHWGTTEWSKCSNSSCSLQNRKVSCLSPDKRLVNETMCQGILKPPATRVCVHDESSDSYVPQADSESEDLWPGETRKPVRKGGPKSFTKETRTPVPIDDSNSNSLSSSSENNTSSVNATRKPTTGLQVVNACVVAEPRWKIIGDWGECNQICGTGTQSRKVYCLNSYGAPVNEALCSDKKPPSEKICAVEKCKPEYHWGVSDWNGCSTQCGEGTQDRISTCIDASVWRFVDDHKCKGPPPVLRKECLGQPLCSKFKWDWEPCEIMCPELALVYCYNITSNRIVDQDYCRSIPNLLIPQKCECYDIIGEGRLKHLANSSSSNSNETSSAISSLHITSYNHHHPLYLITLFITILLLAIPWNI